MALTCAARFKCLFSPTIPGNGSKVWPAFSVDVLGQKQRSTHVSFMERATGCCLVSSEPRRCEFRRWRNGCARNAENVKWDDGDEPMDDEDRLEWRQKIWEVIDKCPDVQEEMDPEEKRRRMQKLLAEYPLVVDEEDPDWPEDADGRGFSLDQFFDKITIKNVKKDNDDDENDDSDKEIVWQDDNYIRPIKDITSAEWEETVFKDISPLIVLVHNRYKRPKENARCRDQLEKAVNIIWNCRLPSPRCVAIDAVVDCELVSALKVAIFPELIFTKAGKILYREKDIRSADDLSKIMAFFYYGAAKPSFFDITGNSKEAIPSTPVTTKL